eukprot:COSAG02_NODE_61_length_43452_cov_741.297804_6_plen_319_part_00
MWTNSGGKKAVYSVPVAGSDAGPVCYRGDGLHLARRKGKIKRPGERSDLRYHQYNCDCSEKPGPYAGAVTLYHVYDEVVHSNLRDSDEASLSNPVVWQPQPRQPSTQRSDKLAVLDFMSTQDATLESIGRTATGVLAPLYQQPKMLRDPASHKTQQRGVKWEQDELSYLDAQSQRKRQRRSPAAVRMIAATLMVACVLGAAAWWALGNRVDNPAVAQERPYGIHIGPDNDIDAPPVPHDVSPPTDILYHNHNHSTPSKVCILHPRLCKGKYSEPCAEGMFTTNMLAAGRAKCQNCTRCEDKGLVTKVNCSKWSDSWCV